jgi:hypothetical protein
MSCCQPKLALAVLGGLLLGLSTANAQSTGKLPPSNTNLRPAPGGILTTRLAPKQLKRWRAIVRLALAKDKTGAPLRPTLYALWQRVANSGHTLYIELRQPHPQAGVAAGLFKLEKFDPQGQRHVASIQLRLSIIDNALVTARAARKNGYVPFAGLRKDERYAEVLGHELAHAAWVFHSPARTRQMEEVVARTNRSFLAWRMATRGKPPGQSLLQLIKLRDVFLALLEREANDVEKTIWQELLASREGRAAPATPLTIPAAASLAVKSLR